MTERTARTFGILGLVLVVLTIPIYFLDLLVVSPNVRHCPAQATDNADIILWVLGIGVLCWLVGVVFAIIAVTQRPSRASGIGTLVIALVIPVGTVMGSYLLLGGDCFA